MTICKSDEQARFLRSCCSQTLVPVWQCLLILLLNSVITVYVITLIVFLQLNISDNEYFFNNMRLIGYTLKRNLDKLRKPPDKYRFVISMYFRIFSLMLH